MKKISVYKMPFAELYGGSFTVQLPNNAKDVSDFRQIPDNQEVFAHAQTDQSLIFEIMEYAGDDDMNAIRTHFSDLATANEVSDDDCVITQSEAIPADQLAMTQCEIAYYILGKQNVAKFNESAKNTVEIHIGLFRLPQFTTDILVSFNNPIAVSEQSTSHHAQATNTDCWMAEDFKKILTSLQIVDQGIFG